MPQLVIEEPSPWSGGHVVVVDDNAASAHMLADFLRMIGHSADIVTGDSVDAIVEAVVAARPDIVFLDIMLGRFDGHAVARALRARGCDAYLVAVTGWGEPDDAAYSLQIGFDEHWTKPLDTNRVEFFMRARPERRIAA
ncbi:MAG TPA: response regulator [Tahibacter sp.]|uniref:response regulator n=1 Tax=Tahibacter sp. TaxID=2056211 RepID=UPI002BE2748A|nr:response regulator [Tahibacter sp.]HSX59628.1 response regulator [Tahibacter sp.]